ncbi:DUF2155 domain-containing protein [Pseudemcibacter aquimaris]|uniref:DUF2155 domain-containing protein n=1 Tax=Pseudemcibacter aquimaris TaxID=2857064 RepID=UPI002011A1C1|nr:DUF2155 domain-containing protein [Pseudemcibacter aquimaris]MCC3860097.1 DUF2155 domain-containing protein [Pseudemcibacter aquimaris]WDU57426.1 DUF2155 domain-containing protein [Pseudemcibacter aquimaris]
MLRKLFLTILLLFPASLMAQEVPVVTLGALNKITAKLETIEVVQDQTVKFGTMEITMRTCSSNPPEETPESVAFLEIVDLGHSGEANEVFKGWMFASSPAVSSLEHAVYDVWVTDCRIVDPSASSESE